MSSINEVQFNEKDLDRIRIQQEGNSILMRMLKSVNIGVSCERLEEFVGIKIERDILNNFDIYEKLREFIPELRTIQRSSGMSSLQQAIEQKQKYPAVNLLRQLLKANGLQLTPKNKSAGQLLNGKKNVHRWYEIEYLAM